MKMCRDCLIDKPSSDYYAGKNACKSCCRAKAKETALRHPERTRATKRRYYDRNRVARIERSVARNTDPSNAERRRATCQAYRRAHRNERHDSLRRWRADNPDAAREHYPKAAYVRRARRFGAQVEDFARQEIVRRDGGQCRSCGVALDPADWHLDHGVPFARGGSHTRANVVAACPPCNRTQRNRLPVEAGLVLWPLPGDLDFLTSTLRHFPQGPSWHRETIALIRPPTARPA